MKIAICDDDKNELFHILSLLADYQIQKNTDFSYKPFESSMELATNAVEERYDIYLLDVVMPGLNGMELAKEIRSYDKAADIIFLTTSPEFAVESYTVKASNYLIKPIQKDQLFDFCDSALCEWYVFAVLEIHICCIDGTDKVHIYQKRSVCKEKFLMLQ